jgi:hypothetical protein
MEHGEPPKITVQPQSTWLKLSQLIMRVDLTDSLFSERGTRGGVEGVQPGSFGVAALAKVLTIRECYGLLCCCNYHGLLGFLLPFVKAS